jgi:organic radical activating enzyme
VHCNPITHFDAWGLKGKGKFINWIKCLYKKKTSNAEAIKKMEAKGAGPKALNEQKTINNEVAKKNTDELEQTGGVLIKKVMAAIEEFGGKDSTDSTTGGTTDSKPVLPHLKDDPDVLAVKEYNKKHPQEHPQKLTPITQKDLDRINSEKAKREAENPKKHYLEHLSSSDS